MPFKHKILSMHCWYNFSKSQESLESVVTQVFIMATHQCSKCLKKTHEDGNLTSSVMVEPNSLCTAPGGGPHSWVQLGQFNLHNSSLIYFNRFVSNRLNHSQLTHYSLLLFLSDSFLLGHARSISCSSGSSR